MKVRQAIVQGEVQQVGYRRRVSSIARRMGVRGYVKNLSDGSVKIVAQGDEGLLDKFIDALKIEESPIAVDKIDVKQLKLKKTFKDFRIISGSFAEELQEGLGAGEAQLYMFRNEFSDYRKEFKDYREEFRDYRSEFKDFAKRTDENFMGLESKYGEISEKLTAILDSQQKISEKLTTMLERFQKESIETRTQMIRAVDSLADLIKKGSRSL